MGWRGGEKGEGKTDKEADDPGFEDGEVGGEEGGPGHGGIDIFVSECGWWCFAAD